MVLFVRRVLFSSVVMSKTDTSTGRGSHAEKPTEIPKRGWLDIAKRVKNQIAIDHIPIVAAGITFYFFLAIFPALAAIISVYGLVVEPAQVASQIANLTSGLPQNAHEMISGFGERLTGKSGEELGWGVALSILVSLWSANKGTKAIFEGLNIAYDQEENRSFIKKNAITLLATLLALITGIVAMALIAGLPAITGMLGLPDGVKTLIDYLRWPLLAIIVMAFLAWIYKVAPNRDSPKIRWVTAGTVVATLLWLLGSVIFSLYVDNFGKFDNTYGSFAAIVILMLWFFLTAFIILLGGEINSETEHQTAADTTVGPDEPIGQRDAFHADHVAGQHN